MKRSLSMKTKIILIIIPALLAFIVTGSLLVFDNKEKRTRAEGLHEMGDFFRTTSFWIHELQKERGKSALFLNGKAPRSEVEAQRLLVDKEKQKLLADYKDLEADLSKSFPQLRLIERVEDARKVVDENRPAKEAVAAYTAIIKDCIGLQAEVAPLYSIEGSEVRLMSLVLIELGKESMGQLRAGLNNLVSSNAPLTPDERSRIDGLKSQMLADLQSPTLVLTAKGQKLIRESLKSIQWTEIQNVWDRMKAKGDVGNYNEDPKLFWSNATGFIDQIHDALNSELDGLETTIDGIRETAGRNFYLWLSAIIGSAVVVVFLSYGVTASLTRDVKSVADSLAQNAVELAAAAKQISETSTSLSTATSEQAVAIQQTSASVAQMNAMISKTSDNAHKSKDVVSKTNHGVSRGTESVGSMLNAIGEINKANHDIIKHINKSNEELTHIVHVISEIGTKTQVINDIVFQTRLLSFNASVEAARAGEHGKGFAVVAEEVGKLAEMSGSAAHQISEMLNEGMKKVEQIVSNTKAGVDSLVKTGKEKINEGSATASQVSDVLSEIAKNYEMISDMVMEIVHASQEQNLGIAEITKAMGQLDLVTQQNSSVAHESAAAGGQLASQADRLQQSVHSLLQLVNGAAAN